MGFWNRIRYVLISCAAGALLASCGALRQAQGDVPPINAPGAMSQSSPTLKVGRYKVIYRFKLHDGVGSGQPLGALCCDISGALYGTTSLGGKRKRGGCCGTVFTITPTGTYNTVYEFRGHRKGDGAEPQAGLIDVNGTLYGTTASGGTLNHGTVYSITPSGQEKVLHSFAGGSDGAYPTSGLLYYNGTLYGTTAEGGSYASGCSGSNGCGTVYSITTSGEEQVLYAFKGGSDGETPSSGLILHTADDAVRGPRVRLKPLYGTTYYGGGTGCGGSGCGIVYSVTPTGQETVLYSFAGDADGWEPNGLDDDRGTMYGTTAAGGSGCSGSFGCGTVYSISDLGYKRIVYNFPGGSDGYCPDGPLIDKNGKLYGTTTCGGDCSGEICGVVYSLTTSGTEEVLHRFSDSADGISPNAPLFNIDLTLYGTTSAGGGSGKGYGRGVIYSVTR